MTPHGAVLEQRIACVVGKKQRTSGRAAAGYNAAASKSRTPLRSILAIYML